MRRVQQISEARAKAALIQQDRDDLVRAFLAAVKEAEGVLTPNVAQKLAGYP
jgi:hypothetical protein